MATVNFIPCKKQNASSMRGTIQYVLQNFKVCINPEHYDQNHVQTYQPMDETVRKKLDYSGSIKLISGKDCCPETAYNEFMATKKAFGKASGRFFYHYDQSFKSSETISPKTAHEIAMKFAEENYKEFEVLVTTHIDKQHLHSHFIINSVSFETGMKLRQSPKTVEQLRIYSDHICQSYGLSTLDSYRKKPVKRMGRNEYRSAMKGESFKFKLMNAIDECMKRSRTKTEFISNMQKLGYGVAWTDSRKNITYTMPNGYKCRDFRLHEEKYMKGNMDNEFRFRQNQVNERRGYLQTEQALPAGSHGDSGRTVDSNDKSDENQFTNTDSTVERDRSTGNQRTDAGLSESNPEHLQGQQHQHNRQNTGSPEPEYTKSGRAYSTGWEESRAFLEATERNDGFILEPVSVSTVQPVSEDNHLADIAGDLVSLGFHLSQTVDPATHQKRQHKPRFIKERKRGIGQREDDNSAYCPDGEMELS